MAKLLNAVGLYTEEQMKEKERRIEELWQAVNKANSFTHTYSGYLKAMTYKDHKFSNGEIEPEELRMAEIRTIADRMADLAGRLEVALRNY